MALVVADINNPFFADIIKGVSKVARQNGYTVFACDTDETVKTELSVLETIQRQAIAGLIITPVSEQANKNAQLLESIQDSEIPVVLVDREVKSANFDGVFIDNYKGAFDGVEALIRAGHRKIGIIAGPATSKPGKDRCQGYLQAMEDSGLAVPEEYVACGDFKIAKAYECTGRLLGLAEPPTAIFTSNNLSTLGCLKYLTEHKVKIGRDISLMGFDDIDALRMIDYRISVVDRDAREQGREAMRLLQECFEDSGKSRQRGKRITIPYKVILRGSEHRKTT